MSKKKTHEEYLNEIKEKGLNVEVLEKYINNSTKILHKCECGNVWWVKPSSILSGKKCMNCNPAKKKTHQEFAEDVYNLVRDEYEILSEYKNSISKVKMKHNSKNCNYYEYYIKPINFLNGNRCVICSGKLKKTHTYYIKQVKETRPNVNVLEEYKGTNVAILHKCECENIWKATPYAVLRGDRCRKCSGNEKLSYEHIKNIINNLGYDLLSKKYKNNNQKFLIKDTDGYYYFTKINSLNNNIPPSKFHSGNPFSIQNINLWCKFNNTNFILLSKRYESSQKKLKWKCLVNNCNEDFNMSWNAIHNNVGCPYCAGKQVGISNCLATKNPELAKEWHPTNNGKLTPYDVTIGSGKKAWWLCLVCKHEWLTKIGYRGIKNGKGCPSCSESHGEKFISNYLIKNNYITINNSDFNYKSYNTFIPQKEFDGLLGLGGKSLSYDFYLPNNRLLIEYQGQQHEKYIKGMHKSKKDFEKQKEHDRRKKEYAQQNGYKLLEIWYWDFDNIEEILNNEFKI